MIAQTSDSAGGTDRRAVPAGTACYYCSYPLQGTVILWWGRGADIHLHPQCAVELSIRLMRDVHEVERATRSHITQAPNTVPAAWTAG